MSMSSIYIGHLGSENSALSERRKKFLEKFRESNQDPYFELYFLFNYTEEQGNKTTLLKLALMNTPPSLLSINKQ